MQENLTNKVRVAQMYGLCLRKNILDRLYRDRHQQSPQDLYHAMARKTFPESFLYLPNLHTNMYLVTNAKNYGTLINTACGVKEAMHGLFKTFVPHTNKKNIDLDLLRHYNTLQALHFWLD
ncbi:16067_t:CDS:2, partial [Racocetra fulgida]